MFLIILIAIAFTLPDSIEAQVNTCNSCGHTIYVPPRSRYRKAGPGNPAIINGDQGDAEQYPWEVLVEQNKEGNKYTCTGSIISHFFLMTAAHCVLNQDPDMNCTGKLGHPLPECFVNKDFLHVSKDNFNDKFPVNDYFPHPKFSLPFFINDIALIRMVFPINCRYGVSPICLPYPKYNGFHPILHVAGWGKFKSKFEKNIGPTKFRLGSMSMVDPAVCNNWFGGNLLNDMFLCLMGKRTHQSICEGDSGSSAFVDYNGVFYALGVTSLFGGVDCLPDKPDVFTKVASYMDWIMSIVPDLPNFTTLRLTDKEHDPKEPGPRPLDAPPSLLVPPPPKPVPPPPVLLPFPRPHFHPIVPVPILMPFPG